MSDQPTFPVQQEIRAICINDSDPDFEIGREYVFGEHLQQDHPVAVCLNDNKERVCFSLPLLENSVFNELFVVLPRTPPLELDPISPEDQKHVDEIYETFWKNLVENPDGTLNKEQVKRELYDYRKLIHNIPKIFCHITGGKVPKHLTDPSVVISLADEHYDELAKEFHKEECGVCMHKPLDSSMKEG